MSGDPETIEGGCLCGACRYATSAAPLNIRACHCHRCQKATGAPVYARVQVPRDAVTMRGPVAWFEGGTEVRRGFCPECGTSLFSDRPGAGVIGLTMGSLDDPDRFHPTMHIWTSSKQAWLTLCDDLPQYEGNPPA